MPSEATQYPHYDWLIGNHCDELTPWIPLIAARCVVTIGTALLTIVAKMFLLLPTQIKLQHKILLNSVLLS